MKNLFSIIIIFSLAVSLPSYAAFPIKQGIVITVDTPGHTNAARNKTKSYNQSIQKNKKDNGVASLVLGIVGIALMPYGVVCSVLAIVFGVQSLHGKHEGQARAGMILGIVGAGLFLLIVLLFLLLTSAFTIY